MDAPTPRRPFVSLGRAKLQARSPTLVPTVVPSLLADLRVSTLRALSEPAWYARIVPREDGPRVKEQALPSPPPRVSGFSVT